ncbi:MAG TPA: hypothetical protein VN541_15830 [Tepidisphaeraceae bacterium]|nr:hypothetical protein [Tepidisphaeraceae bacterium]
MQRTHDSVPTLDELRREEDRLDWLENHRPRGRMRRPSARAHALPLKLEHLIVLLAARLRLG